MPFTSHSLASIKSVFYTSFVYSLCQIYSVASLAGVGAEWKVLSCIRYIGECTVGGPHLCPAARESHRQEDDPGGSV